MRVAILGCGAMGTVLGAYMTKNGCPVDMIDNYQAHVDALNEKGAHIVGMVDMTIPVKALTPDQMEGIYDIVFLFTKQTANTVVLPNLLPHLGPDSTVCTLQNGVPEPFVAEYVGEDRTVGGTVLWGATFVAPGVSELTQDLSLSDHLFEIGEISGAITPRIQKVAEILGYMGHAAVSDKLMASRWGKLIYNACMSGMSAACGLTFGEVLEDDRTRACLSYIGHEVVTCAKAVGYTLPDKMLKNLSPAPLFFDTQEGYDASQEFFYRSYAGMETAKASMLQDLEKDKPTEVRMINGYVSQTGDKYGIDTPFNDKIVEIVSKIEAGELPLNISNISLFDASLFVWKNYKR